MFYYCYMHYIKKLLAYCLIMQFLLYTVHVSTFTAASELIDYSKTVLLSLLKLCKTFI